MNKFDRVTAILLHLQTHPLVRAQDLADRFHVTERTIYRDIRSLETAGVPVVSEPGVGYYLDKSYRLPPIMFSRDEVAALLIGSKIIENQVDDATNGEFQQAINKVRSVLDSSDRHYLDIIDNDIVVEQPSTIDVSDRANLWLRDCRRALSYRQTLRISYAVSADRQASSRVIEPIGLHFIQHHWHLIAWCRVREDYRDFRLDRIRSMALLSEQFRQRDYRNLQEFLQRKTSDKHLHEIHVRFTREAAQYVDEQRFYFGFFEENQTESGVEMKFLVPHLAFFAGWLLQYGKAVELLSGDALRPILASVLGDLAVHWRQAP